MPCSNPETRTLTGIPELRPSRHFLDCEVTDVSRLVDGHVHQKVQHRVAGVNVDFVCIHTQTALKELLKDTS